ncbi:MAG: adenine nucleotide alpha hydrolase [Acidobacteria bacterium]|nr:adenine nucleotide alpha hydrolase [Acidobacteriota bacterium]
MQQRLAVLLAWSGGKDSAWALHELRSSIQMNVVGLFTTFRDSDGRVSMHGVRRTLIEEQAQATGLPLTAIELPDPCPSEEYESRMGEAMKSAEANGIQGIAFADLFLDEVRRYRERKLALTTTLRPIFPLWKLPTWDLAQRMVGAGLRARVVAVDRRRLDESFLGREFDRAFLADLPEEVDPCGENGEFHTFVYGGPMLEREIHVSNGETRTEGDLLLLDLT